MKCKLFIFLLITFQRKLSDPSFSFSSTLDFQAAALSLFRHQYNQVEIYQRYCDLIQVKPSDVSRIEDIPFLPVDFFKRFDVFDRDLSPSVVFKSSGTTGMVQSRHLVAQEDLYRESFRAAFELFYGAVTDWCILALLPSYLERDGSSLIYMVEDLIEKSKNPQSGFYLHDHERLYATLLDRHKRGLKTLLIGVTYGLLDLVEKFPFKTRLPHTIVMETGGMKGKRREMVREEVHSILKRGLGQDEIHSEYGMTELLSQAYSSGNGIFHTPPWMRILIREANDPLALASDQASGGINIIDLANRDSCAFIATQDLGKRFADGSFEVLGRFDSSDIRGCNLLMEM